MSLDSLLDEQAGWRPRAVAIWVAGRPLSYAGLREQTLALADHLLARGLCPGDTLAAVSASAQLITLLTIACSRLGVTFFPLSPRLPRVHRDLLLQQAGVSFKLLEKTGWGEDPDIRAVSLQPFDHKALQYPKGVRPALIIATSGSSGPPKAVMLSERALLANAGVVNRRLDFREDDCWLHCLSPSHIGGLAILYRSLVTGGAMQLIDHFSGERVWQEIKQGRVTHLSLVPAMLHALLQVTSKGPPPSLRVSLIGGAPLSPGMAMRAHRAAWPLWASYGMSEMASQIAAGPVTDIEMSPGGGGGLVLPLLEGVECEASEDADMPSGGPGILRVRGESLMLGYANPERKPGVGLDRQGWFVTGDLGEVEAGKLWVRGRADEVVISGGEKVQPDHVEELLLACKSVEQVCVIGRPDPVWGQRVCAVYRGDLTEEALETWCKTHLAGVFRPRCFVRVQSFPTLPNGKTDRQAIRRMLS